MNFSLLVLATMAGIGPASAFVSPPTQTRSSTAPRLETVEAAMVVDPISIIAGVGVAVSAIGGAAVVFGKRGGEKTASVVKVPEAVAEPEPIDVSIPYDAAASLAFNAYAKSSSTKVDFKQFQNLYYEQMVAEVKAKVQERKVNEMKLVLAEIENEASGIKGQIETLFSASADIAEAPSAVKVEATPVAVANGVDLSIDYNGAAKLAYASSDKSMDFESFREVYEADTVAMVAAKNPYKQ